MDKNKVKECCCVGWEVDMCRVQSGGFKATIQKSSVPMPTANKITEVHPKQKCNPIEEISADTLDDLENKCKKVIRQKEGLQDYEVLQGWRCRNCLT